MIKGKRVNVCEDCYIPMKEYKPWNKGMTVDSNPEIKEKLIAGGESTKSKYESGEILPRVLSEEEREKLSLIKKEYYKKYPEKHPCRILAKNKKLGSYPERLCMDYLDSMGIKYEYNKSVYPYYPDFMFDNIILEVDGYYWHTDKEKDKKRDEYLTNAGYTVFRIPAKNVIEHLKKFVNDVIINNHQGVG
jgi:very-short-patch-repair endonuclease